MSLPTPPNIQQGQIALDSANGVVWYRDSNNNLVSTTWSWLRDDLSQVSTDDQVTIDSNLTVSGDLVIQGDTVSLNVSQLLVEDNYIILNSNYTTGAPVLDAGIQIVRGNQNTVSIKWNEATNKWQYTNDGITFYEISSIVENSVILGTHTTGDYVENISSGTGVTIASGTGEGSNPIVSIGQEVSTSATPTFARVIAPLTGTVTGNVYGQVSDLSNHGINSLNDVSAAPANGEFLKWDGLNWTNDFINLTTDTVGEYVSKLSAGTGVSITNNSGEGATPNISIGQPVGTADTVTFNIVNADLTGDVTGQVSDISNHGISDLSDVTIADAANGDFLRYNGSNWINDPVNLTTDTVGDYVAKLASGTGITITNNAGEGSTPNISFSGTIDDLLDIQIATPKNGQLLQFNGTEWVNAALPTNEPMGHENRLQSVMSFDNVNRRFSISPVSGSHNIWALGIRYVKTTTETIDIPNVSGLYYIYYNSSAVLSYKQTFFDLENEAPTAYVYWNEFTQRAEFFADERHGITLDWQTHEYLHRTRGAAIASGFNAHNYTIDGNGNLDSHAWIGLTGGTFFDEDIQVDIIHSTTPILNSWYQELETKAKVPVFYRQNGNWTKALSDYYVMRKGTLRSVYNSVSLGVWTQTDIDNAKFGIAWLVATNNILEPVIAVMGQAQYLTVSKAEEVLWADMDLGEFPVVEFRPLYKVVFETSTAYSNTNKAAIRGVYDLRREISSGANIPTVSVSDHGSMSGLNDDDHIQYLNTTRHDSHDHSTVMSTVILDDISDVLISEATPGQFLKWNGSNWINSITPSVADIDDIDNVSAATPSDDQVLTWDDALSQWVPKTFTATVASLDSIGDVNTGIKIVGDYLYWNGTFWQSSGVTLGAGTTGDYVKDLVAGSGISILGTSGEGSTPIISVDNTIARSTINVQTGTSYSLVLSDLGKLITMDNVNPMTVTVPLDSSQGFAIGDKIDILRKGSGTLTITQQIGVTVNATPGKILRSQWSSATLIKLAINTWVAIGDLQA